MRRIAALTGRVEKNKRSLKGEKVLPQPTCQICGSDLHDARSRLMGVCLSAKCQLGWARRLQACRQAESRRQAEQRQRLAEAYRDQEAAWLGIDRPDTVLPVVVPANLRRVVILPERRRRAFRDFVMRLLSQAAAKRATRAERSSDDVVQDSPAAMSPALEAILRRGCATCGGRCCNSGGDCAYQEVATVVAYMRRRPELRPRHVLAAYLSHLPNKAYEDSCVYHAETGCALPREMRSPACADFYCAKLRGFQQRFAAGTVGEVVFFAFEGTQLMRAESPGRFRWAVVKAAPTVLAGQNGQAD
jgi:hypothetical protein